MSIVIALIIVLVVGALVANFYPKPNKTIVTAPEPEVELAPETFVVVEPLVETKVVEEPKVEEPKVEAPKMSAKPKKKPQPKKKPTKAKVNA
jgi:outer membrane biosynthesis protein TonB